ncbi:MAG: hypothetical protein QM537_06110 [Candidatus Symbiobacter sp.]|nr:hypothetical protein [Candidatus Symbiobacter sp.]
MTQTNDISEVKRFSPARLSKAGWLILLPVAFFALPTLLLVGLAMLPTLAAYLSDQRREKYATLCVGGFNFAATVPYIMRLWSHGVGVSGLHVILSNIWMWLVIYLVAALGWLVYWAVPGLIVQVSKWHNQRALLAMQLRQEELLKDWGNALIDNDLSIKKGPKR